MNGTMIELLAGGLSMLAMTGMALGGQTAPKDVYAARDFSKILGMRGLSDQLIQNHFKLYQGYVKNTNTLYLKIDELFNAGKSDSPEYAELKRRFGFEINGIKLHEYYFENLGGKGGDLAKDAPLAKAMIEQYHSYENWKKDFVATGKMRGVGWAVLYLDPKSGLLLNCWINEHHVGHPAGCVPLLIMDVWEHAFMLDYQLDRAGYIDAFFNNLNWDAVTKRYSDAVK